MNFICSNYRLSNFNKRESLVYQDFDRTESQLVCLPPHSVRFSRSVVSDSLRPRELQHARPPCPSPTPEVHQDSPHYPHLISNFFSPAKKKKKEVKKSHCTRPLVISSLTLYAHEFLQTLPRGQSETPDFSKNKYPRPGPLETSDGPNLLGWLLHTWTARAD